MKLAIIDLDGVIANPEQRFKAAELAKSLYLASTDRPDMLQREATDHYWRTVFDPDLVELDTLIPDVKQDLEMLRYTKEYEIMFLTSRPESMRLATDVWLYQHDIQFLMDGGHTALTMKASAFQYTKTVTWKAGMVQTLTHLYGASQVLVVDDEQANLNEIVKHALVSPVVPGLMIAKSLAEAVAKLNGTYVKPEPFMPEE